MSIETLARAAGETIETVQLCEREGLLCAASNLGYDEVALAVLRLVRLGQRLRIPLDEIKRATALIGDDGALDAVLRGWAQKRLGCIAREQEDLRSAQAVLLSFLSRSQTADRAGAQTASQDLAWLHRELAGQPDPPTSDADRRVADRIGA
jgi:DNA-binding transcriptional MerR regulator